MNLDLKKEYCRGSVGVPLAILAFKKFKMFLELKQFTLASLRTARLENRTGRHGNSQQLGNKTHYKVYRRKTVEKPQERKPDLV